ncbi:MAG: PIN domain-containing protein [Longimicrobiales bacterium]
MRAAYVDSSWLIALGFGERDPAALAARLESFDEVFSSNLLEAEVRSAFAREGAELDPQLIAPIGWVLPKRRLSREIVQVLTAGYTRGADLWHLASALYLAPNPQDLAFLSLDDKQLEVARQLGFAV